MKYDPESIFLWTYLMKVETEKALALQDICRILKPRVNKKDGMKDAMMRALKQILQINLYSDLLDLSPTPP